MESKVHNITIGSRVLPRAFSQSVATDASNLLSDWNRDKRVSISTNMIISDECKHNAISENTWNYKAIC